MEGLTSISKQLSKVNFSFLDVLLPNDNVTLRKLLNLTGKMSISWHCLTNLPGS